MKSMPSKLILVKADKNVKEMADITLPYIKEYAKRVGADFGILSQNKGLHYHYRILQLHKWLTKYDRVLVFDCDILIRKDCPNLFDIVPEDKIGTVLEDKGSRLQDRRERIYKAQKKFGDIDWRAGYINSGVIVFSKCHRPIFKKRELWLDNGYDDVYLGYWIHKLGYEIYELPYQLNHMRCFSESWNGNPSRFDSYIMHYAGGGFTGNQIMNIKNDLTIWKMKNLI